MRVCDDLMSSDLPILNAEQYIDTAEIRPTKKAGRGKKSPAELSEDGPRKRAKTSSKAVVTEIGDEGQEDEDADADADADADEDEKSKRARGRPRLDTKDQNAAERRRTQIRLAQRAYRNRKENAIQTLENEVKVLQETTEEMSNAFMKLHDFVISQGILEKTPTFAKELQSTTEKFLRLAKKSNESSGEESRGTSTGKKSSPNKKSPTKKPEKPHSPDVAEAPPVTMSSSLWGYSFHDEAQEKPPLPMGGLSQHPPSNIAMTQAPLGYEIVTMPAFDNSTFSFDPGAQDSFFAQGAVRSNQQHQQQVITPNITPPAFSPSMSLPMPSTGAYSENTFGRRLQRSTIEFASRLSTMPNPPSDKFAKVFGFCLLYESVEQIRARLQKALEKTRQESLHNWRVPFWALGGIGQHQLGGQQRQPQQNNKLIGNQGTIDVAKHGFGTNFGIGPFDTGTTEARDRQLDANMRIMLPGFQGEFFDPDEVELYLQSRGVCIQPGQDYVTVEVDVALFENQQQQTTNNYNQWVGDVPPPPPPPADSRTPENALAAVHGNWMGERGHSNSQAATHLMGLMGVPKHSMANRKHLVTLNVDVFIQELMNNGVCLGRTPAFRQKDVNKAFWTATSSDGDLSV